MKKLVKFLLTICKDFTKENLGFLIVLSISIWSGLVVTVSSMMFPEGNPEWTIWYVFLASTGYSFLVITSIIMLVLCIALWSYELFMRTIIEYIKKTWNSIND